MAIKQRLFSLLRRTILVLLPLLFLLLPRAHAAGEFSTSYDVSYAIAPSGTTIVTQNVSLTNNTTNLYPKQYSLTLDSTNIANVIAYDQGGVIAPTVSQNDGKTEVLLLFNQEVVGIGKIMTFSLRYEQGDIAHKNGTIWEVNVPGITPDPDLVAYDVSLAVPPSFGPNAYLTPPPANGRKWIREQMVAGGISGAWGEAQHFDLTLAYHLTNTSVTPTVQTITLPPDTAFQKVHITSLTPSPAGIEADVDGNWIASYGLAPGASIDIEARLRIQTFLAPREEELGKTIDEAAFLRPTNFWQVASEPMQNIAKTLKTPRDVYNYVVATLSYDYERVGQNPIRKGALAALAAPQTAICMEFTDLFVTLARAAGIPAREVIGYAHTTNSKLRPLSLVADVLHAWPEYFDSARGVWIPVDPTWADTTGGVNYFDKLDFNHVAFAIHGASSETPYSAGFFRKAGSTGKDVTVAFADVAAQETVPHFTVDFALPNTITAGWQTKGKVIVKNTGGVAAKDVTIVLQAEPYHITQTLSEQYFPPLGTKELDLPLAAVPALTRGTARVVVTVNGETFEKQAEIRPLYTILIPVQIALIALVVALIWLVRKKIWHRKNPS